MEKRKPTIAELKKALGLDKYSVIRKPIAIKKDGKQGMNKGKPQTTKMTSGTKGRHLKPPFSELTTRIVTTQTKPQRA